MFAPRDPKIELQMALCAALLSTTIAFGYLFFQTDFFKKRLNALHLGSDQVLYFSYVSKFETTTDTSRTALGSGFVANLSSDLSTQDIKFQKCRQFFLANSPVARFRVKVMPQLQKLQVKSLMSGADSNGPHAACLRDTLEDLKLPSLVQVPNVSEEEYRLVIDIQPRVSAPQPSE